MDAHKLEFPDGSFDLAVSTENFEHLKDPEQSLREVVRVLRPEGMCFIATPNREVSRETNRYHTHEFTLPELRKLLERHFAEVDVWPSMLTGPELDSLRNVDKSTLTIFGQTVDATFVSNTHSMFSFARKPIRKPIR